MKEASIVVNGIALDYAQSLTLRAAVSSYLMELQDPDALGTDELGRAITAGYKARLEEISKLISRGHWAGREPQERGGPNDL